MIAPNVDTPYSYAWMDLRAEPVVITVPAFERERYLSLVLFDLYTWIIGYVSPRTHGQAGGDFLVVPPGWKGSVPSGIRGVFRSTTTLALGMFRTQLLGCRGSEERARAAGPHATAHAVGLSRPAGRRRRCRCRRWCRR